MVTPVGSSLTILVNSIVRDGMGEQSSAAVHTSGGSVPWLSSVFASTFLLRQTCRQAVWAVSKLAALAAPRTATTQSFDYALLCVQV